MFASIIEWILEKIIKRLFPWLKLIPPKVWAVLIVLAIMGCLGWYGYHEHNNYVTEKAELSKVEKGYNDKYAALKKESDKQLAELKQKGSIAVQQSKQYSVAVHTKVVHDVQIIRESSNACSKQPVPADILDTIKNGG